MAIASAMTTGVAAVGANTTMGIRNTAGNMSTAARTRICASTPVSRKPCAAPEMRSGEEQTTAMTTGAATFAAVRGAHVQTAISARRAPHEIPASAKTIKLLRAA